MAELERHSDEILSLSLPLSWRSATTMVVLAPGKLIRPDNAWTLLRIIRLEPRRPLDPITSFQPGGRVKSVVVPSFSAVASRFSLYEWVCGRDSLVY